MGRVIGLTGGIASGKSTVAALLREHGAAIVDADLVARQVVEPGTPALAELVAHFGGEVLDADGRLDRAALGARVFSDPGARATVNAITHPRIAQASQRAIAALVEAGNDPVIYEAALIVENNLHRALDGLIVVAVARDVQLERLMARDGVSEEEATARLAAQLPLQDKVAVADWVIDNGGSYAATRERVADTWARIRAGENAS